MSLIWDKSEGKELMATGYGEEYKKLGVSFKAGRMFWESRETISKKM